jgi:dolichyl-phosphate beta-glucosyltransferase
VWSLVLPFHSDFQRLHSTLLLLSREKEPYGIKEVLLCHNGPRLKPEIERSLIELAVQNQTLYFHTDRKGIGAGYRLGIQNAEQPYCLLSASDLPFGFSDLDSFYEHRCISQETPSLAIGSKAHRATSFEGLSPKRRVASWAFFVLRRLLLGRETPRDTQGTILIATGLARGLIPHCRYDDFFFSVEIITLAQRRGVSVVELPVRVGRWSGASSVSVVRDGWRMARRLVELSRRSGTA